MPALHFTAAPDAADSARATCAQRHEDAGADDADIIVALGGDGFMLQTLHSFLGTDKPIYGMNLGSVGFLMNEFRDDDLIERLAAAERAMIHPLRMKAHNAKGVTEALAFNEVSLLRETRQAAKIRILVDDKVRIAELICDGVLVSTPAGSHRLQSFRPWTDPADRRGASGADADQRLSAPALARRAAAASRAGAFRNPGSRQAPGQRRGRRFRSPRCHAPSMSPKTAPSP